MKRKLCKEREARKPVLTDRMIERQLAKNTAELKRMQRSLQVMGDWNRKLALMAEDMVINMANNGHQMDGAAALKLNGEIGERYALLTPRERQVMEFVVDGLPNKRTAAKLGTAEITIKIHRANVMKKMKAGSVADLVRMGERLRIVRKPNSSPEN